MILSEFAFLCGEEVMINLYLTMSSIPRRSAECLCSVSAQAGCLLRWLLAGTAMPLECSHLLMDAVISLGSFTISVSSGLLAVLFIQSRLLPSYVYRY